MTLVTQPAPSQLNFPSAALLATTRGDHISDALVKPVSVTSFDHTPPQIDSAALLWRRVDTGTPHGGLARCFKDTNVHPEVIARLTAQGKEDQGMISMQDFVGAWRSSSHAKNLDTWLGAVPLRWVSNEAKQRGFS